MAELIWETIGPNYKKVTEKVEGNIVTITTEERIGLNCAEKLFAVCGDNALPNNTFCNHLHQRLLQDFDDNWTPNSNLPRCRFHGRLSQIRCIAYIIALVVNDVLNELKSGTQKEAAELVKHVNNNKGAFTGLGCSSLSVYQKVCTFVLWIQGSDERRKD